MIDLVEREFGVKFNLIDKHEFLRHKWIDTSFNIHTLIGNNVYTCTHNTWYSEYATGWVVKEL